MRMSWVCSDNKAGAVAVACEYLKSRCAEWIDGGLQAWRATPNVEHVGVRMTCNTDKYVQCE
jgi:hypothetical protein